MNLKTARAQIVDNLENIIIIKVGRKYKKDLYYGFRFIYYCKYFK